MINTREILRVSLLPVLILLASIYINADKYDENVIKAWVHVLFQWAVIYGLLSVFRKRLLTRTFISLFIVVEIFTKLTYGASLSVGILMSILSTSPNEITDFIAFNLLQVLISLILLVGMVLLSFPKRKKFQAPVLGLGLFYLIVPTLVYSHELLSSSDYSAHLETARARGLSNSIATVEFLIRDITWRFPPLNNIRAMTDTLALMSHQTELSSTWTGVTSDNSSNLLVIGIGESLRADNLSIYGYNRNTTPKLSELSANLDIYKLAYSGGANTWTAIPAMLTLSGARPNLSKSIINLAKDAGYETYWFSNHAQFGVWDFAVSSIAKQADHVYFSSNKDEGGHQYDDILASKLDEALNEWDDKEKKLIVLHFYGSHALFSNRYPTEYSHFKSANSRLDEYDNSVLYTDYIQSKIINSISMVGGKYLFFSDHGLGGPDSNIPLKHDVRKKPSIESLKVPFFVFPKTKIGIKENEVISLFHFECIFSKWSGISSNELKYSQYCDNALGKGKISFIDSSLLLNEIRIE